MLNIQTNFTEIKKEIHNYNKDTNLIVVTKGQDIKKIKSIVELGHRDFGENRVQEAHSKWLELIKIERGINLHLIGRLQSNKAKEAFELFNFIHTLDSEKLAKIFSDLELNSKKKINYFVQVNIGQEKQKGGIEKKQVLDFVNYCILDLKLNIRGLMCIPPLGTSAEPFFLMLKELNKIAGLNDLSMGMSNDYKTALKIGSTYIRIGSAIFN
jgi:hypothetical protein